MLWIYFDVLSCNFCVFFMSININTAVFMNNNAISYLSISCTPKVHRKHSGSGPNAFLWIVTSLLYINMSNLIESSPLQVLHSFSLFFSSSPSPFCSSCFHHYHFHHSLFLSSSSGSLENQREVLRLLHQRIYFRFKQIFVIRLKACWLGTCFRKNNEPDNSNHINIYMT